MAMGRVSVCNDLCENFKAMTLSIATAFATLVSVTAGKSSGVTAEQLSKVFCISMMMLCGHCPPPPNLFNTILTLLS